MPCGCMKERAALEDNVDQAVTSKAEIRSSRCSAARCRCVRRRSVLARNPISSRERSSRGVGAEP